MRRNLLTVILIISVFLVSLTGCVPAQYRQSLQPGSDYPSSDFPLYDSGVLFEYSGGNIINARVGVKDEEADILAFYKEKLDGAYYLDGSDDLLEGLYKDYHFKIAMASPTEEESKAFDQVYTMQIEKLSLDLSGNYMPGEDYPESAFKVYDGARVFQYNEQDGDYEYLAGTDDDITAVQDYYTAKLADAIIDEQPDSDGGLSIDGYRDGYIFTIHIKKAEGDERQAFNTIISTSLKNAEIDYGSAPQQDWSLCLTPDGSYDVRAMEHAKNGYVLAGQLNNDAWVVKVSNTGGIEWQSTFGGSGFDAVNAVTTANDGGMITVGNTNSSDGDVTGLHEGTLRSAETSDIWITKLDADGQLAWQKTYGGSANEYATGIYKTDGGYIIMATTGSEDGDVADWHKGYAKKYPTDDIWILKIDESGAIQWQKTLGGTGDDQPGQILLASDGGYVVCGATWSQDGDISRQDETDSSRDIWAVKLSPEGKVEWQRTLGGRREDYFDKIVQTDSGFYIAGSTRSQDVDISNGKGSSDYWVVKLSADGDLVWQNSLGGSAFDYLEDMQIDENGGVLVTGWAYSDDGDKTKSYGDSDMWTVKLGADGTLLWEKTLGGSRFDSGLNVYDAGDYGYIVAGYTSSMDGDVTGRPENEYSISTYDYWLADISDGGDLVWEKVFGGTSNEHLEMVLKTPDGGYLLAGTSYSTDNEGAGDIEVPYYWVLKLKHGYTAVN